MKNSEFENEVSPKAEAESVELIPLSRHSSATCNAYKVRILGKWLFIKDLKPSLADDARYIEAFRKEQEVGMQLDHPNLPRYVLPPDILRGHSFVAMEFIDGVPLNEFIAKNPDYFSSEDNLRKFIAEISSALTYLHSRQTLHLDLKPSNVMLTRIGSNVKLIDFGFSLTDAYPDTPGYSSGYAPPERMREGAKSEATDYYSLGKLLEFIRKHTHGYPGGKFLKLEKRLLFSEPQKRIHSESEIERTLRPSRVSKPIVAVSSLLAAIAVLVVFLIFPVKESGNEEPLSPPAGTTQLQEYPVPAPSESAVTDANTTGTKERGEAQPQQPQNAVHTPDIKEIEELQKTIRAEVRAELAPLGASICAAMANGDYSQSTYDRLQKEIDKTYSHLMKGGDYAARHREFNEKTVYDIVGEEISKNEGEIWADFWKEYKKKANEGREKDK